MRSTTSFVRPSSCCAFIGPLAKSRFAPNPTSRIALAGLWSEMTVHAALKIDFREAISIARVRVLSLCARREFAKRPHYKHAKNNSDEKLHHARSISPEISIQCPSQKQTFSLVGSGFDASNRRSQRRWVQVANVIAATIVANVSSAGNIISAARVRRVRPSRARPRRPT